MAVDRDSPRSRSLSRELGIGSQMPQRGPWTLHPKPGGYGEAKIIRVTGSSVVSRLWSGDRVRMMHTAKVDGLHLSIGRVVWRRASLVDAR